MYVYKQVVTRGDSGRNPLYTKNRTTEELVCTSLCTLLYLMHLMHLMHLMQLMHLTLCTLLCKMSFINKQGGNA